MGGVFAIVISFVFIFVAFFWLKKRLMGRKSQEEKLVDLYQLFLGRLKNGGEIKKNYEGPLTYMERVLRSSFSPQSKDELKGLFHFYMEKRYGNKKISKRDLWWFRSKIKGLTLETTPRSGP